MKKILLVGGLSANTTIKEQLIEAEIPEELVGSLYFDDDDSNLEKEVARNRPNIILYTPGMPIQKAEWVQRVISNAIGTYDIDSRIYSLDPEISFMGVGQVSVEEVVTLLKTHHVP